MVVIQFEKQQSVERGKALSTQESLGLLPSLTLKHEDFVTGSLNRQ